jgi:hypothetical protein
VTDPLVTIPGLPGQWQSTTTDVEHLSVGDVIQWWIPKYAEITTIVVVDADTQSVTLDNHRGSVTTIQTPRTVAGQTAAALQLRKLRKPLAVRSWWEVTSGAATGSIWYVRADGLLYCDDPGPSSYANGSIVPRAELGVLAPA